jgi:hypothetical protein
MKSNLSVDDMPAKSIKQQRFMGMVRRAQKTGQAASPEVAEVAASMKKNAVKDFASTKHKGLPMKKEEFINEEDYDRMKDRRMERGGVGGNQRDTYKAPNTKKFGTGKTQLQKDMEKKHGKGASALDIVKAEIRKKHGKGAIKEAKKDCVKAEKKTMHNCAKKVCSEQWGVGECIYGQHAIPDAEGNVAWYDVMFEHGIEKCVDVSTLEVLEEGSHGEHVEHQGQELTEKKKGLWDNIHAKRKRGEKPAKPGDKDYPETLNVEGYGVGEVDQKVGAVTAIPKKEQDDARARILAKTKAKRKAKLAERADTWHPDPEEDRKLGGPGANQRAREDRAAASKPKKKEDPKKLRPGESYMDYAKRQKGGSSISAKPKKKSLLGKLGLRKEGKSFKSFLEEGNRTGRMMHKSKTQVTGHISADRGSDEKKNKEGRKNLEKDLKKHGIGHKKGVGEYKYGSGETGREVSYQTSKPDKMSKRRFGKVMRRLGRKHGQESVITKDKDKSAKLHYTEKGSKAKSDSIGKTKAGKHPEGYGETSGTKVRSKKLPKKTNKGSFHYG